jgi:hypothetical protein
VLRGQVVQDIGPCIAKQRKHCTTVTHIDMQIFNLRRSRPSFFMSPAEANYAARLGSVQLLQQSAPNAAGAAGHENYFIGVTVVQGVSIDLQGEMSNLSEVSQLSSAVYAADLKKLRRRHLKIGGVLCRQRTQTRLARRATGLPPLAQRSAGRL